MLYVFLAVSPPIIRSSRTVHTASSVCVCVCVCVCAVLEPLMMGGETARNMYSIDSNKEYYRTLHLVGCT
jgi:hypothetical protein